MKVETNKHAQYTTRITVRAGSGNFPNGELVEVSTDVSIPQMVNIDPESYYAVCVRLVELGTKPTPAQNAFLFDKTDSGSSISTALAIALIPSAESGCRPCPYIRLKMLVTCSIPAPAATQSLREGKGL